MSDACLLELRELVTEFKARRRFLGHKPRPVRAVDGVDLSIHAGEIVGLVGESGCGKSTLGRTILGVQRETAGRIRLDGVLVSGVAPRAARRLRQEIQYTFQDAGAALDPWWSIGSILDEGLRIHGERAAAERARRIADVMERVGLDASFLRRYPHELSGGQLRRVGLARALVLRPRLIVLDEPTSGLDPSVQAAVLKLLIELRESFGLTYLLISHDLSVVERLCDRVAIMYLGRLVEDAPAARLFSAPTHPYTRALLASAPRLDPDDRGSEIPALGEPPDPSRIPSGCSFRNRCAHARASCAEQVPERQLVVAEHHVACLRWRELQDTGEV